MTPHYAHAAQIKLLQKILRQILQEHRHPVVLLSLAMDWIILLELKEVLAWGSQVC